MLWIKKKIQTYRQVVPTFRLANAGIMGLLWFGSESGTRWMLNNDNGILNSCWMNMQNLSRTSVGLPVRNL
uniref:Uncharacterized protein n=1 Tax=Octopus bimaculoides TaxID=37653 RepID=A0A0L8HFA3_OCTBM